MRDVPHFGSTLNCSSWRIFRPVDVDDGPKKKKSSESDQKWNLDQRNDSDSMMLILLLFPGYCFQAKIKASAHVSSPTAQFQGDQGGKFHPLTRLSVVSETSSSTLLLSHKNMSGKSYLGSDNTIYIPFLCLKQDETSMKHISVYRKIPLKSYPNDIPLYIHFFPTIMFLVFSCKQKTTLMVRPSNSGWPQPHPPGPCRSLQDSRPRVTWSNTWSKSWSQAPWDPPERKRQESSVISIFGWYFNASNYCQWHFRMWLKPSIRLDWII